jgi:cation:H+ antiporter
VTVATGVWTSLFVLGVAVSLGGSWLLVSRLERLGERIGLSEGLLGLVAALAADAPEITSAVTALSHGQESVGAGVVIGSNVFNLAALLGLGAVVAGRIALHRRVVWLSGTVAVWVAAWCLLTVLGLLAPLPALALVAAVLVPYAALLGLRRSRLLALPLPRAWTRWLSVAVYEEDIECAQAFPAHRGTWRDGATAGAALLVVVAASTLMERAATTLGTRFRVADIVTGGLVLAIVTSLPNAVAAVYLAARGRGAAVLSTALNSNALNVAAGFLLPAALLGLGPRDGADTLVAAWYAGLTLVALALAYRGHGLTRAPGALVIAGYLVFVGALLAAVHQGRVTAWTAVVPAAAVAIPAALLLARHPRLTSRPSARAAFDHPLRHTESLLPGWTATRLWRLSVLLCFAIAAVDAVTGHRLILIGLLIVGPCCALLTGRWRRTAGTGVLAFGLGVLLGVPDGVFDTAVQYIFLGAIGVVAVAATVSAALIQRRRGDRAAVTPGQL